MEKNPKSLTPSDAGIKTYPGQTNGEYVAPLVTGLLPTIFRTDTNKKVLSAVAEDLFQPSALEDLNFSVGRNTSKTVVKDYLPHPTARRQLEAGLVVYTNNGAKALTADNIADAWELNDRSNETPVPVSVLDLPIDSDKFVNWTDYYWIEQGMPVIYISAVEELIDIQNDIIGKSNYVTPVQSNGKQLELKNGMRIVFQVREGQASGINGDYTFTMIATGEVEQPLNVELTAYNKTNVRISINNENKQNGVDFIVLGNTIKWLTTGPAAGATITVVCNNFFLNDPALNTLRRWQVSGVGSHSGIQLLGRTHQYTNTVYSKAVQTLWDETAVSWDSVEWDGAIRGINQKHYVCEQVGAENRNAHSRVNVWYHKTVIQQVADFLGLEFSAIANNNNKASRPIIEFDRTLELFNNGVTYCAWPNLVVDSNVVAPIDIVNIKLKTERSLALDTRYVDLINKLKYAPDLYVEIKFKDRLKIAVDKNRVSTVDFKKIEDEENKVIYEVKGNRIEWLADHSPAPGHTVTINYRIEGVLLKDLRILWLADGNFKDKILTYFNNGDVTSLFHYEHPSDGRAVVVDTPYSSSNYYLNEFYWFNGEAKLASFRSTWTQQPRFELYDANQVKLSTNPIRPLVINTTIIKVADGDLYDNESGYNLEFLPSQFTELSKDNTIKNAMYDIVYNHTLHKQSTYEENRSTKNIRGPYSFRRFKGGQLADELSIGYRKAWFRLRSWVTQLHDVNGQTEVQIDNSAWPTYEWVLHTKDGNLVVAHSDDNSQVVDNHAIAALGEPVTFKTYISSKPTQATITSQDGTTVTVPINQNGVFGFTVSETSGNLLTVSIAGKKFYIRIINVKNDPRNIKLKLNGLPIDYAFNITRNADLTIDSVRVLLNGIGKLEICHQGINAPAGSSISAIPGFELNPTQDISLGKFTVSRLASSMLANINSNKLFDDQQWIECPQLPAFNGALMVDHSAMRSAWASTRLSPTVQDVATARSVSAWRWYRKFISKIESNNNLLDLQQFGPRRGLDRILEELLLGITFSSADAISGVAFSTNAMRYAGYVAVQNTNYLINTGTDSIYQGAYGTDHVYVYVNDELISASQFSIVNNQIIFNEALTIGDRVDIYYGNALQLLTGIPASPTKLGLAELYVPQIVTESWGDNTSKFIQLHNGSKIALFGNSEEDIRNKIILEFENRIYLGCIFQGNTLNSNYLATTVSPTIANAQIAWYAMNNIDYRDRNDYVSDNAWTWNYNGKSWRAFYIDLFGTDQLHTSPWKALGYADAPSWWELHYSWTNASKRQALIRALQHGIVTEPGTPETTVPEFARSFTTYPVNQFGKLLAPGEWNINFAPTADIARLPWEIGALGPAELAWRRSVAGHWATVMQPLDDYSKISDFVESGVDPFVRTIPTNSPRARGDITFNPSYFAQSRPVTGIGAMLFEAYREFNLPGENPLEELMSIAPRLEFALGGFADSRMSLKMYYAKFQTGSYVPDEDFFMTLNNGVSMEQLRYSAVRLEKDDAGFRVYGYDPSNHWFDVFAPVVDNSINQISSRRSISTSSGDFTEYLNWIPTSIRIPYGTYITNKQDLLTLLLGLGECQKSKGLLLDEINSRGTITDWKQAALDAFTWIDEQWDNNNYCIIGPVTNNGLKIYHATGTLDRLDADLGRTGKILFANGRSALASELLITRDYEKNVDKITPITGEQILFADLAQREYEHVVYVNLVTKFGDLVADLQTNNRLDVLSLNGRRTTKWDGRPHARGVIIQSDGLLPGFDSLSNDVLKSHFPENNAFDTYKSIIARGDVVPVKATVLTELIQDKTQSHLYQQGLQSSAGTNLAINAIFRDVNIDVPGRSQDVVVNEEWLFNTGKFGNIKDQKIWEFEVRKSDVSTNRQIVRLSNGVVDKLSDNIIDINMNDRRWVTKPQDPFNFIKINRATNTTLEQTQSWLPSAGVASIVDVDIQHRNISSVTIDDFKKIDQSNKFENLDSISYYDTLTTRDIFSAQGFSRNKSYNVDDLAWSGGVLFRAKANIPASSTSVIDPDLYEQVDIDSRLLPVIWVTDFAYSLTNKKGRQYRGAWSPGVDYSINDVVYRNGLYYTCTHAHTSLGQFIQSQLDTLTIIDGGEGYTVSDTISFVSDQGTGASARILEIANGKIAAFTVNRSGTNYETKQTYLKVNGQRLEAFNYKINYKNIIEIGANSNGIISKVKPTAPGVSKFTIGNNYTRNNVEITIVGNGTGAVLVPIIEDQIQTGDVSKKGIIQSLTLKNGGLGYSVGDVVRIRNTNNADSPVDAIATVATVASVQSATATAVVQNGSVTNVNVVQPGSGYVTPPTVTIAPPNNQGTITKTVNYSPSVSFEQENKLVGQDIANQLIAWIDGFNTNSFDIDPAVFKNVLYNLEGDETIATKWGNVGVQLWQADTVVNTLIDQANIAMQGHIGSANTYVVDNVPRTLRQVTNGEFTVNGLTYTKSSVARSGLKWSPTTQITAGLRSQLIDNAVQAYIGLGMSNGDNDTTSFYNDPSNIQIVRTEVGHILDLIAQAYTNTAFGATVNLFNYTVKSTVTPRQAVAQAILSANGGSIASYVIVDAGAGYVDSLPPTVTVSGQSSASKAIATLTLTSPGQSYLSGGTYQLSGGTGTGGSVTITSVTEEVTTTKILDNGVITGFTVANGGKNYTSPATIRISRKPTVFFSDSNKQEYRRAFASVLNGRVNEITINPNDQGNVVTPSDIKIQIIGNGLGAIANPIITNGKLTGVEIVSGGSGYTTAPLVRVIDPYWANDVIEISVALETITAVTDTLEVGNIDNITIYPNARNVNFSNTATVEVVDPTGNGNGAQIGVKIANGVISKVTSQFTNDTGGSGYVSSPTVVVSGGSSTNPAILQANIKSFWVLKNSGYGWNILQTFGPIYVEEVCPNALNTGLNESKVTFASPHGLREGEYFVLSGCNDGSYDSVHAVKAVVDDYNVTIAARSSQDAIAYNVVAFKLLPVKFDSTYDYEETKNYYDWKAGMKAYVDKDDNEVLTGIQTYNFKVYEFQDDGTGTLISTLVDNVSQDFIDTQSFYKAQVVDTASQELLATLEIYDPYKGQIIDEVAQYISYKEPIDPAVYNIDDLDQLDSSVIEPWDLRKLGTLWWDISYVRYNEYEQGTLEYRAVNWAKQAVDSEVRIYEWVSSMDVPSFETPGIYLDDSSGVGQPRYCKIDETTPEGATITMYYYWKRNVTSLPTYTARPYTAKAIEDTLNNPDSEGVAWISPIDNDLSSASFLISNIQDYFTGRDSVIIRVEQDTHPEQKHTTGVLVSEGMTGTTIPEYLYIRLRDSLVSYDGYRHAEPIFTWDSTSSYKEGDIISYYDIRTQASIRKVTVPSDYHGLDMPILKTINGTRNSVTQCWHQSDADGQSFSDGQSRYGVFKVLNDIPAGTWSSIRPSLGLIQGALVKDLIEDNRYYLVTEHPRRVPDSRLHPTRRYGNSYVPYPQTWFKDLQRARRTCLEAVNDKLLKIDVVSKPDWDKNLRTYIPLLGRFITKSFESSGVLDSQFYLHYVLKPADTIRVKVNGTIIEQGTGFDLINDSLVIKIPLARGDIIDVHISTNPIIYLDPESNRSTKIWDYADYVVDNYIAGNETIRVTKFDDLVDYPSATIFAIVDDNNITQQVYKINNGKYDLIYRKNGTIQFVDLWYMEGWDTKLWDSSQWDRDYSEMFGIILNALRENIFIGSDIGYFNLTFFDMVRESLSQIPAADWVYKTTYLSVNQSNNNELEEIAVYYDKKDKLIKDYLNEVKPYHSKYIDQGTFTSSMQEIDTSINESIKMRVTDVVYLATEQGSTNRVIDYKRNGNPVTVNVPNRILTESGNLIIIKDEVTEHVLTDEG